MDKRKGTHVTARDLTHARMVGASSPLREKDDFYPTPPEATRALLSVEKFTGAIWEPTCGDGAISRVLEDAGHTVISSDLVDRGYGQPRVDFLMERTPRAPNIITNAPYKLAVPFITNALALTEGKVAMLFRLAFLEGKARKDLFTNTPLKAVYVFSGRLPFLRGGWDAGKGGGGMIAFSWLVWDHAYNGKPIIGWL